MKSPKLILPPKIELGYYMSGVLTIFLLIMSMMYTFAQAPDFSPVKSPPIPLRTVNGVIKDSTGAPVPGANVILLSKKDSLKTVTNMNGIFSIKNAKEATFLLTVNSLGYQTFVGKYKNNDEIPIITLDQIILKAAVLHLNEVQIDGRPTIIYKPDTIEYRASDYKVRENSTLDELLKKAEGFEVFNDGTLTHQGQEIKQFKLNGKIFSGGAVAQAIQNLPADIVEKFQVIDDYGYQAAKTGIKDGYYQKTLNVTTKIDRSIGTFARMNAQGGNDKRFNTGFLAQRINANQELGFSGNLSNTLTGLASSGGANTAGQNEYVQDDTNGGPGTSYAGSPAISYRDQWGKNTQVSGHYNYAFNKNKAVNDSYGQRYTNIGTSHFVNRSTSRNDIRSHKADIEIEHALNPKNYLRVNANYHHQEVDDFSDARLSQFNHYQTGFEHLNDNGVSDLANGQSTYGLTGLYFHTFRKAKRNFSVQINFERQYIRTKGGTQKSYRFFEDSTVYRPIKDSAVNLGSSRTNRNSIVEASLTYTEPLSKVSFLEFIGKARKSFNDSRFLQDTILADGQSQPLINLSQIFNYSINQQRLTINYRFSGKKLQFSLGSTAIPFSLMGSMIDNNTGGRVNSSQFNFRIIPTLKFAYNFSQTARVKLFYSGENREPYFLQLQPFTDRSDPRNIVVGNPKLKPEFSHNLNFSYDNYIANQRLNFSVSLNASLIENKVTSDIVQARQPLDASTTKENPTYTTINIINFANVNGTKSLISNYSISKRLGEEKFIFSINGTMVYDYTTAMSNNGLYHTTRWRFNERLGPRLNPTDNIEINPYVGLDVERTFTTALNAVPTNLRITKLAINGKFYFFNNFQMNYSASKNFISGISEYNTNPLVINAGCQLELLRRHNLSLTFNAYDILHENSFIQQVVTPQGVSNTLSNVLSRYFMFGIKYNIQKWSGTPSRNGKPMKRRGDGSFVY